MWVVNYSAQGSHQTGTRVYAVSGMELPVASVCVQHHKVHQASTSGVGEDFLVETVEGHAVGVPGQVDP